MTECNLGQGTEPKVTPGSQGAQPQRSLHFLCSWLRIPSFPSTPGQGRSLCPRSPSAQDQKFPLPSTSSPFLPGSHCSEPFYSLRFSLFFQNLHSKAALHIPALISKLFFFKKKKANPSARGRELSVLHFVGSVWWGRREGRMSLWAWCSHLCHGKIQVLPENQDSDSEFSIFPKIQSFPLPWSSSQCPWMSWLLLLFVPGSLSPSEFFDFVSAHTVISLNISAFCWLSSFYQK